MLKIEYGKTPEEILELMKEYKLDFDMWGDDGFINMNPIGVKYIKNKNTGCGHFVETGLMYPSKEVAHISGNFFSLSSVFSFFTDDKELITKFEKAIETNEWSDLK